MGTAIKHPVPHRVKPSLVIFDIRMSKIITSNSWVHRMLYSSTYMATVDVRGLTKWNIYPRVPK